MRATEATEGWGIRIATQQPCLAGVFWSTQVEAKAEVARLRNTFAGPAEGRGYRAVRVVLVPYAAAKAAGLVEKDDERD